MSKDFLISLTAIQPSQLYISRKKLREINVWFNPNDYNSYEAIPIKKLNNKIIFTDGHTRAYSAYLNNVEKIKVYWDEDDLDWNLYEICVHWCIQENINSIKDLEGRVIDSHMYEELWLKKCESMHKEQLNK